METIFPARVVKVITNFKVAINRGINHNLKIGQRFLVYGLSENSITDPDTGEDLGKLEIVRGTGKIIHLQEKLATIESDSYLTHPPAKRFVPLQSSYIYAGYRPEIIEEPAEDESLPFDDPELGDYAKPI